MWRLHRLSIKGEKLQTNLRDVLCCSLLGRGKQKKTDIQRWKKKEEGKQEVKHFFDRLMG